MARSLVPIKVKIGLKKDGSAKYPDFNSLEEVTSKNMDWSKYVDVHGSGWLYDSVGHKKERLDNDEWDSPFGIQWGVLLIPQAFADEAVAAFPNEVEKLDETRTQKFYDEKHAVDQPEEFVDTEALQAIKAKEDLGVDVTAEKAKALDPDDPAPGIRKNPKKKWVDYKKLVGISVKK